MKLIGPLLLCGVIFAQVPSPQQDGNAARGAAASAPIFRVDVTARTAKAINYQHRSGATKIDFKGTNLLPGSRGEAKVESKQGYIEIEVEFDGMQEASKQGNEYLTYVLWAITPEGRTSNLGEILLNGSRSKLNVTTELQVFGLVVTAEPYYAVTRPSDMIVMENVVRADTRGKIEEIDAKYELLQRGQYQRLSNPLSLGRDPKIPLELYEARNAVQIARSVGADRFAVETFEKAQKSLTQAELYQSRNAGGKPVTMTARETVQTAEDARAIAVKRQEEEALAAERRQAADREASARTGEAQAKAGEAAARTEIDRVTRDANEAQAKGQLEKQNLMLEKNLQAAEADRLRAETDARLALAANDASRISRDAAAAQLKAEAETKRVAFENEARLAAVAADAERARREAAMLVGEKTAEAERLKNENDARSAAATAENDRLRRENEAQRLANDAERENAAKQKTQLEKEKAALRAQLLQQFNAILQTRDTARGLVINMSDVLFDTGKYSLRQPALVKLAKVAGILSGHPGLHLAVEGHTDSVGGDEYNQKLSEQRGEAVRDYLAQEGMPTGSVTTAGRGKSQPVASNDTARGRQQNRRVELVISGELIGTEIGIVGNR